MYTKNTLFSHIRIFCVSISIILINFIIIHRLLMQDHQLMKCQI